MEQMLLNANFVIFLTPLYTLYTSLTTQYPSSHCKGAWFVYTKSKNICLGWIYILPLPKYLYHTHIHIDDCLCHINSLTKLPLCSSRNPVKCSWFS